MTSKIDSEPWKCPIFDGSASNCLTRYQKLLWGCSLGCKNLLNFGWDNIKFHNHHQASVYTPHFLVFSIFLYDSLAHWNFTILGKYFFLSNSWSIDTVVIRIHVVNWFPKQAVSKTPFKLKIFETRGICSELQKIR